MKVYNKKWKIPHIALLNDKVAIQKFTSLSGGFVDSVLLEYQKKIVDEAPVGATGLLKNTIFTERNSPTKGRVYLNTKYGVVVNSGRKASPVSASADPSLEAWIKRSTSGRAFFSGLQVSYPKITIKQAIFLLKRSKKKKPTKANPFFNRGKMKASPRVSKLYSSFVSNLAKELMT